MNLQSKFFKKDEGQMETQLQEYKPASYNPLNDIISDEIYEILNSRGLFNQTSVRDWQIRKKFKQLREKKISVGDAIEMLLEEYSYLQFDTLKKIVHHPPKNRVKNNA